MKSLVLHHVTLSRSDLNMADCIEERFDAAVNVVRSMPKKGISDLLEKFSEKA